ncbi:ATP-dependent DNA helicase RecG [Nitrospira defluvii]|uniref:ATP-dependent DNA helicase RecG n=1 Tax=Nitrospira defluvii TaxID=330214 RepID=A0ABM8R7C4_9BACT|nr:ATP-dependent DNA helicase RecG [Nitrospira defluvii]
MPRPDFPHVCDPLRAFLHRVIRPIEFACRDAHAHLQTVKNLDRFVSEQVIGALGEHVYPRAVEVELLSLRNLFVDFYTRLTPAEQRDRLTQAFALLRRLQDGESMIQPSPVIPTTHQPPPIPLSDDPPRPLWELSIQFVKGVGPKRTILLQRLGISTVEEALWTLPWRYDDRSVVTPVAKLVPGGIHCVCGVIIRAESTRARSRRLSILDVSVQDATGTVHAVFFNQPYLEEVLREGGRVMMAGRVVAGRRGWMDLRLEATQFEVLSGADDELLHVGRIVPIYHETKGWTSRQMRVLLHSLLAEHGGNLEEVLPLSVRARHRLPPIGEAIQQVHFPASDTDLASLDHGVTAAHRRLAFEELFLLQAAMALRQRELKEERKAFRFNPQAEPLKELARRLPFTLTAAQERVWREIQADMVTSRPMNRLVQGDVGSGKTVVALHALVMACGSGCQAALMVPTEILAEQHYLTLKPLLESVGLNAVLLTGSGKTKARHAVLQQVRSGKAQVAIGTHALIQKRVQFARLGLVVVDEQHKFGVLQRKTLLDKGYQPDVLVMTATPIPRTLAMTVYGDLDVSVIDMLPPGRKPVRTMLYTEGQRHKTWQLVGDELKAGRQAYIVYPLVEESEKIDLKAAIQGAEELRQDVFPTVQVGLLHGRMATAEKEQTMAAFKAGTIQILVATTVIEVGVDVPNATVMVIEHAERFGLAQLHQLRGRVGRGAHQSMCILMASYPPREAGSRLSPEGSPETDRSHAQQRLAALVRSHDGFVIAEEDLRIRGPGEFLGLRQWGMPEFRAANLVRDAELLELARQEASALLAQDPRLTLPQHQIFKGAMLRRWKGKLALGAVS